MSIDWSMAPEEAIGAMVAQFDTSASGGTTHIGKVEFICSVHERREFREGPDCWEWHEKPEATPWTGEGMPPVGAVCEIKGCMSHYLHWNKVTVFAVRGRTVFFDMEDGRWGQTDSHEIRPLRTPEQIAADERESAVNGMLCHDALGGSRRGLAEALYDAGYRLQVQP